MTATNTNEIRHTFETTDNRTHKIYRAIVVVVLDTTLKGKDADWAVIREKIESLARTFFKISAKSVFSTGYSAKPGCIIGFSFALDYEKPSLTPKTYEAMIQSLGLDSIDTFHDKVRMVLDKAIEKGVKVREAEKNREETVKQANMILTHFNGVVDEAARKACRFNQRLAALYAELEAERIVQAEEVLDELDSVEMEEGVPAREEAIKAAKENLVKYVGCQNIRSQFGSRSRGLLKEEDVFASAPTSH